MTDLRALRRIEKTLKTMKPWQSTAFATAMAQRSLPNYVLFAEVTGFGDVSELNHCLNMLWDYAAGQQSSKNFERLLERLDEQTPDVNQFAMYGVYPALDMITALTTAIQSAMDPHEDDAYSNARLSLATISQFITEVETTDKDGSERDDKALALLIEQHPLIQHQLDFIEAAIELLQHAKPNKTMKTSLRELAMNDGVSELGISLEG